MKRKITAAAAGLLALTIIATAHLGLAQEKPGVIKIAVVDVQFLTENSSAAKNVRAQIEKIRANYQLEVIGKLESIKKDHQNIEQERSKLSENAYQQRMVELRQKAATYQTEAQEREAKLDAALRGGLQKIAAGIEQSVNEVIKEQKLTVVLSKSSIIGMTAAPDITQQVLKRLNQRTPSVTIELPK